MRMALRGSRGATAAGRRLRRGPRGRPETGVKSPSRFAQGAKLPVVVDRGGSGAMARQDPSPKRPQPAAYRFGGHTLDLARGVLRSAGGDEVGLRPKAAEVLRHLAERAGRVVSR